MLLARRSPGVFPCCEDRPLIVHMKIEWHYWRLHGVYLVAFVLLKGPAADATDALQPWGLLCNPVMKMVRFFCLYILMEQQWNEIERGKPKYLEKKTCPIATLSTTNPTWTDPGSNPGLRNERPATNRQSHGTAHLVVLLSHSWGTSSLWLLYKKWLTTIKC